MHLPIKISSLALFVTFSLTACGSSGGGSAGSNKNETVANNPQIVQNEKALQTQLEKLKQQQENTLKALEDERQKLAKKTKELQDLKSNTKIDQEKLSSLQKDLEQNKACVSNLEKTLSKQQTQAEESLRNLEAQLAAANSALNEKSKALEDLQNNQNADQAVLQKAQTELQASQSEVAKLNQQLGELKQLYPQAEFAMGSRVRIDSKHYSKLSESLSGLLPNTQKMADEQVTRNILFAPKIAGKLIPQGQIQRHKITQKVNGKDVEMDYFSYHYNEDDAYLAEVWSDNSLGYVSVVAYGGKATPIEKFDAFKQAQVVKEYDVKMAPGTGRYWDSYDTTFTADFGNEKISGIAKKIDLNNAFTANEDIIFPEQPIFVKDDAIRFGGNKPSVKIKFKYMEDTMKYEGMFIGENGEKIVGRVGGSSLVGKEKK